MCDFHTYLSPNIFQAYFKLLEYHLELDTITLEQVMEIKVELEEFMIEFEQLCQNKETKNFFYIHELNRSEEHTSELQSRGHLVCRLLLEKKRTYNLLTFY